MCKVPVVGRSLTCSEKQPTVRGDWGVQGAVEGGRGQPSPPAGPQGRGDHDRVKQGCVEGLCYRTNPLVSRESEVRKLSVKGQRINIICFMGHNDSALLLGVEATIENTSRNGHG